MDLSNLQTSVFLLSVVFLLSAIAAGQEYDSPTSKYDHGQARPDQASHGQASHGQDYGGYKEESASGHDIKKPFYSMMAQSVAAPLTSCMYLTLASGLLLAMARKYL